VFGHGHTKKHRSNAIEHVNIGMIPKNGIGFDTANLHRWKRIKNEHHNITFATHSVGDIDRCFSSHRVTVGGDVGL